MINRRTFTAMLAGLPFLRLPVNAQPKTVDVCENCGDYPKISRENPHAFSVHFGDNVSGSAGRFVIYAVRLDGQGLPLTSVREMIAGKAGLVVYLLNGKARVCEQCFNGTLWRIGYGHVEVEYEKGPRFTQSEQLYAASKRRGPR